MPKSEEYPVFSKLPIDLFASELAPAMRSQIEGRYVLIGGDIQDLDDYETPMYRGNGQMTKGLEVHAHLLAQVLDGRMPGQISPWSLWLAAFFIVVAGGLTSLLDVRGWKLVLILIAQLIFFAALPFYLQANNVDTLGLPAGGWGVGWAIAFASVLSMERAVGAEERRFAQSALGKYLPRDIAEQIVAIRTGSPFAARRSRSTRCSPIWRASPSSATRSRPNSSPACSTPISTC
jgi:adenylate cyclase